VHLLLVGASHRTAPVELRERLDFSSRGIDLALKQLSDRATPCEAVVLSTCNRAELYVACEDVARAREDLVQFVCDFHRLSTDLVTPHLYSEVDTDAARHLFRVASGLESLVVGEPQILGQVKDAFSVATSEQTAGPLLNKLFHWAFGAGKRVRSETALAEGAVSVSYAAAALAKKIFGDLTGRSVLVVGSGEMGKLAALHLTAQGVARVTIVNRTLAHAGDLAAAVGGEVASWDQLPRVLLESDIVITATGSPTPILDRARVQAAMPSSRARPLFVIDIAVPRDVDPAVGDLEEVFLYNIDDLQAIVHDSLKKRGGEIERAEEIVDEEVAKFAAWQRSRSAIPTLVALRQRFETIRRAELERLEPKLAHLPPDTRARVDDVTRLIVEKLLLHPTVQLKTTGDPEIAARDTETLNRLFGLDAGSERRYGRKDEKLS